MINALTGINILVRQLAVARFFDAPAQSEGRVSVFYAFLANQNALENECQASSTL